MDCFQSLNDPALHAKGERYIASYLMNSQTVYGNLSLIALKKWGRDIRNQIYRPVENYLNNKTNELAAEYASHAKDADSGSINPYALLAQIYLRSGKADLSEKEISQLFAILPEQKDKIRISLSILYEWFSKMGIEGQYLKFAGPTRNTVYFGQGELIIKQSNNEDILLSEMRITSYLYGLHSKGLLKTPVPRIVFYSHLPDKSLLVLSNLGRTLSLTGDSNSHLSKFRNHAINAFRSLAEIQTVLNEAFQHNVLFYYDPINEKSHEYLFYRILNKFIKACTMVMGSQWKNPAEIQKLETLKKFVNNLQRMIDKFPRLYYKDANPGNWIIMENDQVGMIDFESNCVMPVQMDFVNLLESGPESSLGFDLYNDCKNAYLVAITPQFPMLDFSDFDAGMKIFRFQRHLELAGLAYQKKNLKGSSENALSSCWHLERGLTALQDIQALDPALNVHEIYDIINGYLYAFKNKC